MCTYYFCCCPFVTFFFRIKPRCGQMDIHSCIKGSVALTKVALKSHSVKQDLKFGEGILARLRE